MSDLTDRLDNGRGWRESGGQIVTGERTSLIEWVQEIAHTTGTDAFREEAALAAWLLAQGENRVRLGHTWYYVTGDDD